MLLLMLLGWAFTVDATCETLEDGARKLFVLPTETQLLELTQYFKGYNMSYALRDDTQASKLV